MAVVYVGVSAATWLITHLRGPLAVQYGPLALAAVFLVTALRMAQRVPGGAQHYGIDLAGVLEPADRGGQPNPQGPPEADDGERDAPDLLDSLGDLVRAIWRARLPFIKELAVAVAVAAVVFPPFWFGWVWWNDPQHPFTWQPPSSPVDFMMAQLVVVGLPEEALFRGYFQTRLSDLWQGRTRVLGVELNVRAWLLQALLFAVLHFIVGFNPGRLAVFFPALLFGWLRAWRGGIGAAVFVHAMSNFYAQILARGFL